MPEVKSWGGRSKSWKLWLIKLHKLLVNGNVSGLPKRHSQRWPLAVSQPHNGHFGFPCRSLEPFTLANLKSPKQQVTHEMEVEAIYPVVALRDTCPASTASLIPHHDSVATHRTSLQVLQHDGIEETAVPRIFQLYRNILALISVRTILWRRSQSGQRDQKRLTLLRLQRQTKETPAIDYSLFSNWFP